ncbi:hypothetical protein M3Y99_01523800 [Aphelenchoides fujianensis]|nr:hypothetical protein M3Y99_01523800 [Aphelenchoides fujianensis]
MPFTEFYIDKPHLKIMDKAVSSLRRLGDDLMFFPSLQGLTVRACNMTRTAAGSIFFEDTFFGEVINPHQPDRHQAACCRVRTRNFLSVMKREHAYATLRFFKLYLNTEAEEMGIEVILGVCGLGVDQNCDVEMCFDRARNPLFVVVDVPGICECTFTLSTTPLPHVDSEQLIHQIRPDIVLEFEQSADVTGRNRTVQIMRDLRDTIFSPESRSAEGRSAGGRSIEAEGRSAEADAHRTSARSITHSSRSTRNVRWRSTSRAARSGSCSRRCAPPATSSSPPSATNRTSSPPRDVVLSDSFTPERIGLDHPDVIGWVSRHDREFWARATKITEWRS